MSDETTSPTNQPPEKQSANKAREPQDLDDFLNLDLGQLSKVRVRSDGSGETNLTSPSSQMSGRAADTGEATTTADLLKQAPSVSARRVSAITFDPRIRGYHSSQLNATANGMNQLKARLDIDTLYSQIDPGIVRSITVIDGPYTSLYGPGFAFMIADLLPVPRFDTPQTHVSTNFVYGTNAQALYSRDNVITGGKDWGACFSYGLRHGDDYRTGGPDGYLIPSSYQKWDYLLAISRDVGRGARIELDLLRTEMNDLELPGVVYDVENSRNDQYNLSYIVQQDPEGPKQFVLQTWYNQTYYFGDASSPSKQSSFYRFYIHDSCLGYGDDLVDTDGWGDLESLGVRCLRTFGEADTPQLTVGVDWRRYSQRCQMQSWTVEGEIAWGTIYGIPRSQMNDIGALADLMLPVTDTLSVNVGGRVDACKATIDQNDPIAAQDWYTPRYDEGSRTLGMAYVTSKQMLSDSTALKAGIAFAMRSPDLTELYNYEAYQTEYRFGNSYNDGLSTLKPEKNLQLDIGLTREDKKVSYGVRAFSAWIRDYILPSPCYIGMVPPDGYGTHVLGRDFSYFLPDQRSDIGTLSENADNCGANYVYVNIDDAALVGGELFGEYRPRDGVSLFGNMSYVYGANNSPVTIWTEYPYYSTDNIEKIPIEGTDGLPGIYPLYGNVGIRLFEPVDSRWSLEFACRMVRKQDHVARTMPEIAAPGYATFALRGNYRLRENVRVSLNIENLFNRAYTEPGSLAMVGPYGPTFVQEPGITVLMGVEARF